MVMDWRWSKATNNHPCSSRCRMVRWMLSAVLALGLMVGGVSGTAEAGGAKGKAKTSQVKDGKKGAKASAKGKKKGKKGKKKGKKGKKGAAKKGAGAKKGAAKKAAK